MNTKVRWITRTGALLALLSVLQFATKGAGQFVTGTCVNCVLALATLLSGLWSGVALAALSPFLAFLLGIGPQILPVVPAIAVGNTVLVVLLHQLGGRPGAPIERRLFGAAAGSIAKFLALYLLVAQLICRFMNLPEKQSATLAAMFSWPQLVTALAGAGLALAIRAAVEKALRPRK